MQQRTPGEPRAQSVLASPGPGALLIAVIALALAFLAFATRETGHTARFRAALDDVMDPSLRDVVGGLMPLTSDTPGIVWDAGVTPDRVLVATWTDYDGYTERESQTINLTRDVWVTPVPQMWDRCRAFGMRGDNLDERLRQHLGNAHRQAPMTAWWSSGQASMTFFARVPMMRSPTVSVVWDYLRSRTAKRRTRTPSPIRDGSAITFRVTRATCAAVDPARLHL